MSSPAGFLLLFLLLTSLTLRQGTSFLSRLARNGRSILRVTTLTADAKRDIGYEVYGVRIDAEMTDPEIFREIYDGQLPVVIRKTFHGTLLDEDVWVKSLIKRLSSTTVQFDVRYSESGEVEVFEGSF